MILPYLSSLKEFTILFLLLTSRARFIPLWKRSPSLALAPGGGKMRDPGNEVASLVLENEKLFVCGVPFQFEGSAECLLFHLLNQDFE